MNKLLLLLFLVGVGIYIYIVLYKYDDENDDDEYQTVHTRNVTRANNANNTNNLNKIKSILKTHENELINDNFIEHKKPNNINTGDRHVHFSEQNDEFVFSSNLPVIKETNNTDLDDIFIKPNVVEPYNNDFNSTKNINLTLSENEYFSKV